MRHVMAALIAALALVCYGADNGVDTNGQAPSQVATFSALAIGEAFFNHSAAGAVQVKQSATLAVDAKVPGLPAVSVAAGAVVERIASLTIQIPAPPVAAASNP